MVFRFPDPDHVTRDDDSGKKKSRTDRRRAAPNCLEERKISLHDSGIDARLRGLLGDIGKILSGDLTEDLDGRRIWHLATALAAHFRRHVELYVYLG